MYIIAVDHNIYIATGYLPHSNRLQCGIIVTISKTSNVVRQV